MRRRIADGNRNGPDYGSPAGKGDVSPFPEDDKKYRDHFDDCYGTCLEHPEYNACQEPTEDCIVCRRIWREVRLGLAPPPKQIRARRSSRRAGDQHEDTMKDLATDDS